MNTRIGHVHNLLHTKPKILAALNLRIIHLKGNYMRKISNLPLLSVRIDQGIPVRQSGGNGLRREAEHHGRMDWRFSSVKDIGGIHNRTGGKRKPVGYMKQRSRG